VFVVDASGLTLGRTVLGGRRSTREVERSSLDNMRRREGSGRGLLKVLVLEIAVEEAIVGLRSDRAQLHTCLQGVSAQATLASATDKPGLLDLAIRGHAPRGSRPGSPVAR
jgi:hypothetical protein